MPLPVRGQGDARRAGARPEDAGPVLFPQLQREHGLHGRRPEPAARERAGAHDQQTSPPLGNERRRALDPRRAQPLRLDVPENDRVVAEQRLARGRKPAGQRRGAVGGALDVEGGFAQVVAAFVDHRVDRDAGIAAEGPLQEGVLVAGPALDQQHAPGPAGGRHEHAAHVVLRHRLARGDGDLDGVEGRALRRGRHRHDGPGDGAVARRTHRHHPHEAAVLEHADLERLRPEPVADGREGEVDGRPGGHRAAGAQVEHLAVARGLGGADAHREDGRRRRRGGGGSAGAGVGAVGHQHDAGQPAVRVARPDLGEGARQIAPARLGAHGREVDRLEPFADAPRLDPHVAAERGNQTVADRGHRRVEAARAVGVGDAHAARPVEEHREHRTAGGRRLHPYGPGEHDEDEQEDGQPQSDQHRPARPRERPRAAPHGGGGEGRGQPQRHPPRPRRGETHHRTAGGAPASDR